MFVQVSHETELKSTQWAYLEDGLIKGIHHWHREVSAHSLFRSPKRWCSLSPYDSFTQKMVLKRQFVGDTGKTMLNTFTVWVLWETELLEWVYWSCKYLV